MKKNVGTIDKIVRLILTVLIGILYFTNVISGTVAIVLLALGVILVVTSLVSFCPLYLPFGLKTCANKENASE